MRRTLLSAILSVGFACGTFHGNLSFASEAQQEVISSPDGELFAIFDRSVDGTQLFFRHGANGELQFIASWSSAASAVWSPDSRKILVTARANTSDQWCEIYQWREQKLSLVTPIGAQIPVSVPEAHHVHLSGLGWSPDSKAIYVKLDAFGDFGSEVRAFLVDAQSGKLIRPVSFQTIPKSGR